MVTRTQVNYIQEALDSLPEGNRPYHSYHIRNDYLDGLLDDGGYKDPEQRRKFKHKYLGDEPSPALHSDTTGGWWSRTGFKTRYNLGRTFESLRSRWAEIQDDEKALGEAQKEMDEYERLMSTIPEDDAIWQDLIIQTPVMFGGMVAALPVIGASALIGAPAWAGMVLGAGTGLAFNVFLNESETYNEELRDAKVRKLVTENNPDSSEADIQQAIRGVAVEAAETRRFAEAVNPLNWVAAVAETLPFSPGKIAKGLMFGAKAKIFATPTSALGKAIPNIRDVAYKTTGFAGVEGMQEGSQDATQQAIHEYTIGKLGGEYDPNAPFLSKAADYADIIKDIDYDRVAYAGGLGALAGGILGGVSTGSRRLIDLPREAIRQDVRLAIESGDPARLEALKDKYRKSNNNSDKAKLVLIEQEIEDIQNGIITDYRVDKEKTRYDLRHSLANAIAGGQQELERWMYSNQDNPLAQGVVNDFYIREERAKESEREQERQQWEADYEKRNVRDIVPLAEGVPVGQAYGGGVGQDAASIRSRRREEGAFRKKAVDTLRETERTRPDITSPAPAVVPQAGELATQSVRPSIRVDKPVDVGAEPKPELKVINPLTGTLEQPPVMPAPALEAPASVKPPDVDINNPYAVLEDLVNRRILEIENTPKVAEGKPNVEEDVSQADKDLLKDAYRTSQDFRAYVDNLIKEKQRKEKVDDVRETGEQKAPETKAEKAPEKTTDAGKVVKLPEPKYKKPSAIKKVEKKKGGEQPSETKQEVAATGVIYDFQRGKGEILSRGQKASRTRRKNRLNNSINTLEERYSALGSPADMSTDMNEAREGIDIAKKKKGNVPPEYLGVIEAVSREIDRRTKEKEAPVTPAVVEKPPPPTLTEKAEAEIEAETPPASITGTEEVTVVEPPVVQTEVVKAPKRPPKVKVKEDKKVEVKDEKSEPESKPETKPKPKTVAKAPSGKSKKTTQTGKKGEVKKEAKKKVEKKVEVKKTTRQKLPTKKSEEKKIENLKDLYDATVTDALEEIEGKVETKVETKVEDKVPPKKSTRPKKRIKAVSEREEEKPSGWDTATEEQKEGIFSEDILSEEEDVAREGDTIITVDDKGKTKIIEDDLFKDKAGRINSMFKNSLNNLAKDGILVTTGDLKDIGMMKGTSNSPDRYMVMNRRKGRLAVEVGAQMGPKLIELGNRYGVTVGVVGRQDTDLEFTFGEQTSVGDSFINTFGKNPEQYIKRITRYAIYTDENGKIIRKFAETKKGSAYLSPTTAQARQNIGKTLIPEFKEVQFSTFGSMIQDMEKYGVSGAGVRVDEGIFPGLSELSPERFEGGLPAIEKTRKGDQQVALRLSEPLTLSGINEGKPVFVEYEIDLKQLPKKKLSEEQLLEFANSIIKPEFRADGFYSEVERYSFADRGVLQTGGTDVQAVQDELTRFKQEFSGTADLNYKVFANGWEASEAGFDIDPRARGAIIDDTVILIANKIKNPATARAVLFHESIGHFGMKKTFGPHFDVLLDEIVDKRKLDVKRLAKRYGVSDRVAAEELIAMVAEGRADTNVARRVFQIIKDWVSRVFGQEMSDAQIRSIIMKAENEFRGNPDTSTDSMSDRVLSIPTVPEGVVLAPESNSIRYSIGTELAQGANLDNMQEAKNALSDWLMTNLNIPRSMGSLPFLVNDIIRGPVTEGIQTREWNHNQYIRERIKASERSIETRNDFGGWYMLPDGGWRFEIPDVDKDGNQLLTFREDFLRDEFGIIQKDAIADVFLHHRMNSDMYGDTEYDKFTIRVMDTKKGRFVTRAGGRLLDFISHPLLEKSYPTLMKETRIEFVDMPGGGLAMYDHNKKMISIDFNKVPLEMVPSAILHELTHAIQIINNFAMGGDSDFNYDPFDKQRLDLLDPVYNEMFDQFNSVEGSLNGEPANLGDAVFRHFSEFEKNRKLSSPAFKAAREDINNKNPRFLAYFSPYFDKDKVPHQSKEIGRAVRSLYGKIKRADGRQTVNIGGDVYSFDMDIDIKKLLKGTFRAMEQERANLLTAEVDARGIATETGIEEFSKGKFEMFSKTGQYHRLLGEMEARDVQRRSFLSGHWTMKDTKPLDLVYGVETIRSMDDAILAYVGDYSGTFKGSVPKSVSNIRYSIPDDNDVTSRRDPSQNAPGWMPDDMKDVFNLPQWGPQHAGKRITTQLSNLFHDIGMKLRQGVWDKFASLRRLSDRAYILARMSNTSEGPLDAMFRIGQIFMDDDGAIDVNTDGKSVVETLSPLGNDLDVFLRWLAAKRHKQLKEDTATGSREALKFLTDDQVETALRFNEGDTVNAVTGESVSREALFDSVYEDFKGIQKSVTDIAVKSGLIDKKTAKLWEDQFYIPFYRLVEEDQQTATGPRTISALVNQKAFNKLKGSEKGLGDLLQNALMNWNHLISSSLKNNAGKESIKEMEATGMAVKLGKYPVNDSAVQKYLDDFDGTIPSQLINPDSAQTVHIVENGQRVYYKITDPLYFEAVSSLNKVARDNPFFQFFRASKRWFTYSVTADPAFKVANLIRDTIATVAVSPSSINMLGNVWKGWKGTAKNSETAARLLAGGGSFSFGHMAGTEHDMSRRLIQSGIKKEFILDNPAGLNNFNQAMKMSFQAGKKLWAGYDKLGSRLENVNRAALYEKLRADGMSHLEASYQARDILDFSNHGSFGAILYLANFSPFLNARLQGLYKLGKAAVDPKQMAQFYGTVGAYSLAHVAAYLTWKDDEDFKAREDWDRDTYTWFKVPFVDDMAFRIPKAFEVGVIATLAERSVEQLVDDEAHGALFANRLRHAVVNTFAFDVLPVPLRPVRDIMSNKNNFTGRPIESMAMQRMSPEERKNAYTSEFATLVARGVHEIVPWDMVELSPAEIEYAVGGWFGFLGASVLEGTDMMVRSATGVKPPSRHWSKLPIVKRFVDVPSERTYSKWNTLFYNMSREMEQTFNDIRELRELSEIERAENLFEKKKLMLKYRKGFSRVRNNLGKINNAIQRISADPNIDPDLKKQKINRYNQLRESMTRAMVQSAPSEIRIFR